VAARAYVEGVIKALVWYDRGKLWKRLNEDGLPLGSNPGPLECYTNAVEIFNC